MTQFLNPDHAGEKMTRSSHSGIIIYLNRDPIIGYSKKYNPVDLVTFVLEIINLRKGLDITKGLRYKIRIMGVSIDGPTSIFCNNKSMLTII